jgi:hypothetical protein
MRHLAILAIALLALVAFSQVACASASGTECSVCTFFSRHFRGPSRQPRVQAHVLAIAFSPFIYVPHRADADEFDLDQFASEVEVSSSSDSDADIGAFHQAIHATAATNTCPAGFRDDGFRCGKPPSYGRGVGCAKQETCLAEAKPLGTSSCEQIGLLFYPNCKPGFHSSGCCTCSPDCPAGWEDAHDSCLKPVVQEADKGGNGFRTESASAFASDGEDNAKG